MVQLAAVFHSLLFLTMCSSLPCLSQICIFDHTMDGPVYIGILRNFLLPFTEKNFRALDQFMQDNNPKHNSKKAKELYEQKGRYW